MALRLIPKRLVGPTVRGIRNRLGQTQEQFAESIGVSGGDVIASWEEGRSQPDTGTLAKIATMGLVDVLIFHDEVPADELPQLTPGEANELRAILSRMEVLLHEAREIVEAAADRTAVEVLEAASSARPPTPTGLEADGAVTLAAEVTVKPRLRAGSSSGKSGSRSGGTSSTRSSSSRSGGSKTTGSGSKSSSGSGSSGSKSSSSGSKSASGGSKSSGGRSGSSSSRSSGSKSGSSSSGSGSSGSRGGSGGGNGGSSSSNG